MSRQRNSISKELRNEILIKTLFASSKQDVTRSIFETIVDAGIDWRSVSVDEVKPILVDALRVFAGRTVCFGERRTDCLIRPRIASDGLGNPSYR